MHDLDEIREELKDDIRLDIEQYTEDSEVEIVFYTQPFGEAKRILTTELISREELESLIVDDNGASRELEEGKRKALLHSRISQLEDRIEDLEQDMDSVSRYVGSDIDA